MSQRVWLHRLQGAAATLICILLLAQPASAMKIQQITSPGGIQAWLVEEHSVPLIAMHFGFKGGTAQDPEAKAGVGHFLTSILDEGAGELSAEQFHEQMEDLAVKMAFDAGRDTFSASFQTLSANRDPAFDLLRLALTKPRFEAEAVERMRAQLLAAMAFGEKDPERVATREWFKQVYGEHPYGQPTEGTKETIAKIDRNDLETYRSRVFARDTLKITVVGDIDARTLGPLLDTVFGGLAAKAQLKLVPRAADVVGPKQKIIEMNVPQSVAHFGHAGFLRKDPDFMAAFVLNYIIGGGGFSSRLMEEVREKRGLAYGISTYLYTFDQSGLYSGSVATKNEAINTSLDVIRAELKRMADNGPTDEELTNAKSYQTGSYPLRFDTNSKIASQLLGVQMEDLGIDYVDKRNSLIEAVTLADIKRVAQRLLKPDGLVVTIVGKPTAAATEAKPPSGQPAPAEVRATPLGKS